MCAVRTCFSTCYRELVLRCHNDLQRGALRMTARCRSVHTDLVPVTSRAVRMEIQESVWRFEAMPAERTPLVLMRTPNGPHRTA